jgi:hypothetical protein
LIRLRLRVAGEDQFAPVGGRETHGEELHCGELFAYDARREAGARCLSSCLT